MGVKGAEAIGDAREYTPLPNTAEAQGSEVCAPDAESNSPTGRFGERSFWKCSRPCTGRRLFCVVALVLPFGLLALRFLYIVWAVNNPCSELALYPWHGHLESSWYEFFPSYVTCPRHSVFDREAVAEAVPYLPVRDASDDAALLGKLRSWLDNHRNLTCCQSEYQFHEQAYEALARMVNVNARDILAFRETWSELDTQLLLELDGSNDGFVPGRPLTRDGFAERLPEAKGFARLAETPGRAAIVGSGGALRGQHMGPIIDEHSQVVRFNDLVGSKLSADDTGLRTTIHVSCAKVDTLENASIAEFDMESSCPWVSYCSRMHTDGQFCHRSVPFLIRPSAYCALGPEVSYFTRGFVFYWFIGRLFEGADLYGFSGSGHFQKTAAEDAVVHEPFLKFEHLVYRLALDQEAEVASATQVQAAKALAARIDAAETADEQPAKKVGAAAESTAAAGSNQSSSARHHRDAPQTRSSHEAASKGQDSNV